MEYYIGVSAKDMRIRQMIENRLPLAGLGGVRISGEKSGYVAVDVEGNDGLFSLAELLADIVGENLQIRFLVNELAQNHAYISQKDRCDILVTTLKELWYGRGDLERARQEVSERIVMCLVENPHHILTLDGVVRFRMKEDVDRWLACLDEVVDEFLLRSEQKEFVGLLRYFVSMREPVLSFVKVVRQEDEYALLDESNCHIAVLLPEQAEARAVSQEDILLSKLVNLAPETIDISEVADEQLAELLRSVFVGRTRR